MNPTNTTTREPAMPTPRKLLSTLAVVAIAASAALLPATPAAAATYEVDCYGNPEATGPVLNSPTIEITANGPTDPVAPGETFSLTDLTVTVEPSGSDGQDGFVTVLGQEIDLGSSLNNDDFQMQWGPMTIDLTAPTDLGVHDIEPEGNFHRIAPNGFNFYCPIEGDPFASVEVADIDPTPTTTTTTVPTNGDNGDDNGDGDDPDGDDNGDTDQDTEAELEAELEAETEALEAETALLVGATPRFTG